MAALEIIALNPVTPQLLAPQTGDTYTAPRAIAVAPEALAGTSATTSFAITQTWNTTGTPTALQVAVTDTASNAASLLMDLRVGVATKFNVTKAGALAMAGSLSLTTDTGTLSLGAASDTILLRDAANVVAQRNGTTAQNLKVYQTYTDASNYQRVVVGTYGANFGVIKAEGAGTGASNGLVIMCMNNTQMLFGNSGNSTIWNFTASNFDFSPTADNVRDVGASATRVRAMYSYLVDCQTIRTSTAYTVATLPAAGNAGRRAYVTDATSPTWLGTLTGGGAVKCPVFDNGTAWVAG